MCRTTVQVSAARLGTPGSHPLAPALMGGTRSDQRGRARERVYVRAWRRHAERWSGEVRTGHRSALSVSDGISPTSSGRLQARGARCLNAGPCDDYPDVHRTGAPRGWPRAPPCFPAPLALACRGSRARSSRPLPVIQAASDRGRLIACARSRAAPGTLRNRRPSPCGFARGRGAGRRCCPPASGSHWRCG